MIKEHPLIQLIEYYVLLNEEEAQQVLRACVSKSFVKNENVLEAGQRCDELYFIEKGTLRLYGYLDAKEVTTWIYFEGLLFTSWASYALKSPMLETIQATENLELLAISRSKMEELYTTIPKLERFGRLFMEEQVGLMENYYVGYNYMSSKEKYENLIQFFPEIEQKVNLGHIASFLGISQETLSRIRAGKV